MTIDKAMERLSEIICPMRSNSEDICPKDGYCDDSCINRVAEETIEKELLKLQLNEKILGTTLKKVSEELRWWRNQDFIPRDKAVDVIHTPSGALTLCLKDDIEKIPKAEYKGDGNDI